MPNQNDQFAAEQFYDKLHAQEVTPQEEAEEPQFCLSAQWMKIVSEFLKAEKGDYFPEEPRNMALEVASFADKVINKAVAVQTIDESNPAYDDAIRSLKVDIYKTAAACLRMLKELNKTN